MKEIEFRGKKVDNGEWVYGYYYSKTLNHAGGVKKLSLYNGF